MWPCLHDSVFCGFDTIPACDRQTDRQTDGRTDGHTTTAYAALAQRRAVKISTNFRWIASEKACKDYSRLRPPKGSHVHRNVVVSKKWCMIHTLLLHTSNRKYHMAYRFAPFPMTLGDLEGHSPVAGLNKCLQYVIQHHRTWRDLVCTALRMSLGVSGNNSDFIGRRHICSCPHLLHVNAVLSFWRFEVEILQQWDKEEKHLLTSELFTETRTFSCNSCQSETIVSFINSDVMVEKHASVCT